MVVSSTYEGFHKLCHYGIPFLTETYLSGRRTQENVFDKPPIVPLGPNDVSYELTGNHTIHYRLKLYPSQEFKRVYLTNEPQLFALGVAAIFFFTSAIFFLLYDRFVEKRQRETMKSAERSSAVVNSLFPRNVRERMFQDEEERQNKKRKKSKGGWQQVDRGEGQREKSGHSGASRMHPKPAKLKLKSFLDGDDSNQDGDDADMLLSPPIADLFSHTTVLFADIVGFTAWSSEREPYQVFQLLVCM